MADNSEIRKRHRIRATNAIQYIFISFTVVFGIIMVFVVEPRISHTSAKRIQIFFYLFSIIAYLFISKKIYPIIFTRIDERYPDD